MTKSNILLAICLVFIGGLFVVSVFEFPKPVWEFLFLRQKVNDIRNYNDFEKKIELFGKIIREPERKINSIKLVAEAEKIKIQGEEKKVSGKMLITASRFPELYYGDELKIIGKLKTPTEVEGFNYQGYLAKDGIYSTIYWPEIEIIGRNKGNPVYSAIFKFKDKLKTSIEKIMPFPEVSIWEGIVFGGDQIISQDLKDRLNVSGLRHLVAVSGMNIVILSNIIMFVLIALGLRRGQAFYFALILIVIFIIMVGAPASAVRAGIMGGILLLAQKAGRLNNAGRLIVFTAAIMLAFNPLLLKYDVGFQLSFLAVLGIIYIQPILDGWLMKIIKKEQLKFWVQVITMTLAAQVATLPILVYNFGRISFISPLANILIVPTISYMMAIGLIFNFGTIIWSFLGKILAWPTYFGLTYIIRLNHFLSQLPFSAKEISHVHWIWLVGYYVLLFGFLIWYRKKKARSALAGA